MISCILPTCRGGKWVSDRIEELNKSSYKDLELIIVEDGKVENYAFYDKLKVKVIKLEENSGSVSIPRAIGISWATGEFISHVDDDVIIFENKYLDLINNIQDNSLCYGNRVDVYLPNTLKNNTSETIYYSPQNKIPDWNPQLGWGIDGGQFIYRSDVWKKHPFIFPKRGCDWETAKVIHSVNPKFKHIDVDVCGYMWHNENRSLDDNTKIKTIFPKKFTSYFSPDYDVSCIPEVA